MSVINFITIEGHQALTSEMAFVLSKLDRQFFPTPWTLESWTKLFLEQDRLLMLVKFDEIVIGFCLFDKVHLDGFAHLLKILIHPDYRKRGQSKKLLELAILKLSTEGCTHLFLEVEADNNAAQRLYVAAGFQIIHSKKDFYGLNRTALIMTKN